MADDRHLPARLPVPLLSVREVVFDPEGRDYSVTHRASACGLLFTAAGQIVLQRRPDNAGTAAGQLGLFGTAQLQGETFLETSLRGLRETLGIRLDPATTVLLGAVEVAQGETLGMSARYLWPVTAAPVMCNEGTVESFRSAAEVLSQPNLTAYARWAVERSAAQGLIP